MGNQQPKKPQKVPKTQIEVACMKSKYHLELMRDRKNNELIKAEKELVKKIQSNNRNKTEEILLAQRIVNALKYAQACNFLMSYAASLKPQATFLSENLYNGEKLQPYLPMIYSLIYAAEHMGLSSLKEFQAVMRALNDPQMLMKYVDSEIIQLLSPQPTPMELNTYFIEMSERNNLSLEEINMVGHKFSRNFDGPPSQGPNNGPNGDPSFSEIQRQLADQLRNNMGGNNGGMGGNNGGMGGNNGGMGGNNGGMGGNGMYGPNQGFNPNNQSPYPSSNNNYPAQSKPFSTSNNLEDSNPYGFRQTVKPDFNQGNNSNNFGPGYYNPQDTIGKSNQTPNQQPYNPQMDSRMSIKSINDIDYYPEVQPGFTNNKLDPDFNSLCERIKTGL